MGSFQTPITIKKVVDNIDSNKYLIPAFQREFVWSQEQIENLFDSLMRGYPISSMLFWEVTGDSRKAYQYYQFLQEYVEEHKIHNNPKAGCESMESFYAILDGQQRLTSLFLGLKGTVAYHAKYKPWDNDDKNFPPMKLYLNLSHEQAQSEGTKQYDFKFRQSENNQWNDLVIDERNNKWFRVGAILTADSLLDFSNQHGLVSSEYKILERLQKVVLNENVINYYLETEVAADKAVDIFVRINSGGRPLSISDILLSIVVAGWKKQDARKEMKNLLDQVSGKGFKINHDYVIKSLQYLLDKPVQSKITTFNDSFVRETEEKWSGIKESILSLFELLKVFGLDDRTLTSYNATMPILFFLYKKGIYENFSTKKGQESQRSIIRKWLLKTLLLKSFGGSSDSTLEQARRSIDTMQDFFPSESVSEGIKQPTMMDQKTIDEILSTQKDQAYAFATLALFYPNIDTANKFNLDHMHPEASFDKYFKSLKEPADKKDCWIRYNSIVNLQMLGENENKSKNDMPLEDWVNLTGKDRVTLRKETYLPCDICLSVENFDEFYSERKRLLTMKLLEELGMNIADISSFDTDKTIETSSEQADRSDETLHVAIQKPIGEKFCIIKDGNRDDNLGTGYGKSAIAKEFFTLFLKGRKLTGDIYDAANQLVLDELHTSRAVFKATPSKTKAVIQLDSGEKITLDMNIWGNNTDCWLKLRDYLSKENPYFRIESARIDHKTDIITIVYEAPYTSFGPQTPKLYFKYDYLSQKCEYQYGNAILGEDKLESIIHFISDKTNIRKFFNLPNIQEGFHDNQEFLTIEYAVKTKTISQDIMNPKYNHPF